MLQPCQSAFAKSPLMLPDIRAMGFLERELFTMNKKDNLLPVIRHIFTDAYKDLAVSDGAESNASGSPDMFIDFRKISGTNCYCDDQAALSIRDKIKDLPVRGIHFLDSGNYHYMTYYWLEKIKEPFCLIVLDHHTDMQAPALGDIMSCGGWVREAVFHLPMVKKIILMGPEEENFRQDEMMLIKEWKDQKGDREEDPKGLITLSDEKQLNDSPSEICREIPHGLPVYFSIDKDILSRKDAVTNWSQGDLSLEGLLNILKMILGYMKEKGNKLLGVDICGEDDTAGILNETANGKIAALFQETVSSIDTRYTCG